MGFKFSATRRYAHEPGDLPRGGVLGLHHGGGGRGGDGVAPRVLRHEQRPRACRTTVSLFARRVLNLLVSRWSRRSSRAAVVRALRSAPRSWGCGPTSACSPASAPPTAGSVRQSLSRFSSRLKSLCGRIVDVLGNAGWRLHTAHGTKTDIALATLLIFLGELLGILKKHMVEALSLLSVFFSSVRSDSIRLVACRSVVQIIHSTFKRFEALAYQICPPYVSR